MNHLIWAFFSDEINEACDGPRERHEVYTRLGLENVLRTNTHWCRCLAVARVK